MEGVEETRERSVDVESPSKEEFVEEKEFIDEEQSTTEESSLTSFPPAVNNQQRKEIGISEPSNQQTNEPSSQQTNEPSSQQTNEPSNQQTNKTPTLAPPAPQYILTTILTEEKANRLKRDLLSHVQGGWFQFLFSFLFATFPHSKPYPESVKSLCDLLYEQYNTRFRSCLLNIYEPLRLANTTNQSSAYVNVGACQTLRFVSFDKEQQVLVKVPHGCAAIVSGETYNNWDLVYPSGDKTKIMLIFNNSVKVIDNIDYACI